VHACDNRSQVFPVQTAVVKRGEGDDDDADQAPNPAAVMEVAKSALSNLLGSMGYFYGSSLVRGAGRQNMSIVCDHESVP
jgi:hypothetical protein